MKKQKLQLEKHDMPAVELPNQDGVAIGIFKVDSPRSLFMAKKSKPDKISVCGDEETFRHFFANIDFKPITHLHIIIKNV